MEYKRVIRFVQGMPWAIMPSKLEQIVEFLSIKAAGGAVPEFQALTAPQPSRQRSVAVLPVFGTISYRANIISEASGSASIEKLQNSFAQLVDDPDIGTIIFDMDTPGGSVPGIPEMAAEIFAARKEKRIIAVANPLIASAGYWLASQAHEIYMMPSASIGSIGVVAVHEDHSEELAKEGVKLTFITAGKHKAEGNPAQPLSDEASAFMQSRVDEFYDMFTSAVAKGKGIKQQAVMDGYGEGRVVGANEAIRLGMADGIGTLDQVIHGVISGKLAPKAAIHAESEKPVAEFIADSTSISDEVRRRRMAYA
jgi:signal peptide peptidase SppA